MRKVVLELAALGPLPSSKNPDVKIVEKYQNLIVSIQKPVTDDEAIALSRLFGPDDCFGLAWAIVHLIESAPSWPITECLTDQNEWLCRLKKRAAS